MDLPEGPLFVERPAPDAPGWTIWAMADETRFNALLGDILVRRDGNLARVRMTPERRHSNLSNAMHGGALLAFMDVALFAAARVFEVKNAPPALTVDLAAQFLDAARIDAPVEAEVELLRETGRLVFLRGLIVQGETKVASFSGTIRKITRRPA